MATTTTTTTTDPFVTGNYAPVHEERTDVGLDVSGAIPPELVGRYLRTGPNPLGPVDDKHHWFVGEGMVHGVELNAGNAIWYRNRYVRTNTTAPALGEAPRPGPAQPLFPEDQTAGNTNVFGHAGRILAFTELSLPYELSPQLDTICRFDFGGPLPTGFTAHGHVDPATGMLHGFAYSFAPPHVLYHRIDTDGKLVKTEEIPVAGPTSMHDFAFTQTRIIWMDLPLIFDVNAMVAGYRFPFRWHPEYGARVGVMPIDGAGSETKWIDIDPCYVFHPLNAYDDGTRIVMDVVRYDTMMAGRFDGPNDTHVPRLARWTIDPEAGRFDEVIVDERGQEFPRLPDKLWGRKHRYGYVPMLPMGDAFDTTGLLKHDLDAGTTTEHAMAAGRAPGEFVFVPAEGATAEDDGYLMGFVYDGTTNRSDLEILDARDFTAAATVHLPVRVPFGFHGNWIPDAG